MKVNVFVVLAVYFACELGWWGWHQTHPDRGCVVLAPSGRKIIVPFGSSNETVDGPMLICTDPKQVWVSQ